MITEIERNEKLNRYSRYAENNLKSSRILFALGDPSISGGTNFILSYASKLADLGAEVTVGLYAGHARDAAWHSKSTGLTFKKLQDLQDVRFDLGICTWWRTVEPMLQVNCSRYVYFMQALETRFGINEGRPDIAYQAAMTYVLGLPTITNASWMQNLISVHTESKVWNVLPGVDKSLFFPSESTKSKTFNVIVEGNLYASAKAVGETIQACQRAKPDKIFFVSPVPTKSIKGVELHAQVPFNKMASYYRNSDVLVKMSRSEGLFGPPIEAFHCGATAIVASVSGYDEYIRKGKNALVVQVDDFESATESLLELKNNGELINFLKANALKTAEFWPSIDETASQFALICWLVLNSPYTRIDRQNLLSRLRTLQNLGDTIYPQIHWAL